MSKEIAVLRLADYRSRPYINDDSDFAGDTSNLYELEVPRKIKAALYTAILCRGYELYMLHCEDDGWYYGDLFLGLNVGAAYIEFVEEW